MSIVWEYFRCGITFMVCSWNSKQWCRCCYVHFSCITQLIMHIAQLNVVSWNGKFKKIRLISRCFLGSGPEGADDLCFHTWGNFSSFSSFSSSSVPPPASRPKSWPWGPNPSLETQILAWRPKSQPWDPNHSLEAQNPALGLKTQPWGPNPGPKTQIPALKPKSTPWGQIPALRPKS